MISLVARAAGAPLSVQLVVLLCLLVAVRLLLFLVSLIAVLTYQIALVVRLVCSLQFVREERNSKLSDGQFDGGWPSK